MQLTRHLTILIFLTACLGRICSAEISDEKAVDASIAHWLPNSFAKLKKRDPEYRVVVIGDDVSNYNVPDPRSARDLSSTWHWQFLERLGGRYHYTGGVRLRPGSRSAREMPTRVVYHGGDDGPQDTPSLRVETEGPTILIDNLSRNGVGSLQALEDISTTAFDRDPDLLLLMTGVNDPAQGGNLAGYRATLERIIKTCRNRQVDVIVVSPPPLFQARDLRTLGLTRPLASVAMEVAAAQEVLAIDAGNALVQAFTTSAATTPEESLNNAFLRLQDRYRHPVESAPPGPPAAELVPNRKGQRAIADEAWAAMQGSLGGDPVQVSATLTLPVNGASEASLELQFTTAHDATHQGEKIPAAMAVLGLGGTWLPRDTLTDAELASGMSKARSSTDHLDGWKMRIPCQAVASNFGGRIWGEEMITRGSVLLCTGSATHLVNFKAAILPISVKFPTGRLEGIKAELSLPIEISNALPEAFKGNAEVVWQGKSRTFEITIPPGPNVPMKIGLPLPDAASAKPFKSRMTLKLKNPALNLDFSREIELAPDLLPGQSIPLANQAKNLADAPPEEPADAVTAAFQFLADANGLYLIFDLPPIDIPPQQKLPSAVVEIAIDARGKDERGTHGSCPYLTLEVPWQDGKFPVSRLPNGLFGAGYDRDLEASYFLASVKTLSSNRRQVRLSVPRNFFYLHQWSFNATAQSTLGLNTRVALLSIVADEAAPSFVEERTFSLVSPRLTRSDAGGLGLLQLAKKSPTWTALFY